MLGFGGVMTSFTLVCGRFHMRCVVKLDAAHRIAFQDNDSRRLNLSLRDCSKTEQQHDHHRKNCYYLFHTIFSK